MNSAVWLGQWQKILLTCLWKTDRQQTSDIQQWLIWQTGNQQSRYLLIYFVWMEVIDFMSGQLVLAQLSIAMFCNGRPLNGTNVLMLIMSICASHTFHIDLWDNAIITFIYYWAWSAVFPGGQVEVRKSVIKQRERFLHYYEVLHRIL